MAHKHISSMDLKKLDRFYRVNLLTSASGFKAAHLIGTYSKEGIANLALFSSVIHLGSNPALLGFIQRPLNERSHTYKNIKQTGYFTINHVHENFIEKAHYTSAKFNSNVSEFESCQLTEERLFDFDAPFVKESNVKIAVKYLQEMPIELNGTTLIIGRVEHLFLEEETLLEDGNIDLNTLNSMCISGQSTYHTARKIKTLPYAQVDNLPNWGNNESR